MVCDSTFAKVVTFLQRFVDDKCQNEEHAETYRPFLIVACILVAVPHHISPVPENFHNALSLDFEECKFDLPFRTSRS